MPYSIHECLEEGEEVKVMRALEVLPSLPDLDPTQYETQVSFLNVSPTC